MTNFALTMPTRTRHNMDLLSADFWEGMGVHQQSTSVAELTEDLARPALTAVLTISGMPREFRPRVETAMAVCIASPSELIVAGADPLTAHWFTQWRRDPFERGLIECREVITGTAREFDGLRVVLNNLAAEHNFDACVRVVD